MQVEAATTEAPPAAATTATAAPSFYEDLVTKLQDLLAGEPAAAKIQACLAQASKDIQQQTSEVFAASKLTDALAKRLLLKDEEEESNKTLQVVQVLAQIDDGATYLPSLAASVAKVVKEEENVQETIRVSSPLLQLWMQQLTRSDSVSVHTNLLDALVILSSSKSSSNSSDDILSQALTMLVEIWKQSIHNATGSSKECSIISVRCATLWIQWLQKLGGKPVLERSDAAPELFVDMTKDFNDPLQQLTLVDLLNEHFGKKDDSNNKTSDAMDIDSHHDEALQVWLASPALLSPILQMLQDPILSGAALQYLSAVLVSLRPSDVETVLDHIRQVGVVSNETERLSIVHALTNLAPVAAPQILQDATIRHAWWDVTRITQSKLQAAILVSVATVLPKLDDMTAMQVYSSLGPDNSTTSSNNDMSTTQWLLDRFVASPIPELRIAAFALLAAMLKLNKAPSILALSTTKEAQASLLELLMDPQRREISTDARLAYFDVLECMHDMLNGDDNGSTNVWVSTMDADQLHKVKQQLHKKFQMGPHGREPQRWDVATE